MRYVDVKLVEKQLAAYNAEDLDTFIACFAEDVEIFRMPTKESGLK